MKLEQLIVQYLYINKKVVLQEIGHFAISDDITIPTEADKDTVLPENAIQFKYDPKAGVDEGLINYIMENTRKIRPLATSDLESFSMLNKQFLNIGKPLIMEGVGVLQKVNDGSYAFTQSGTSHVTVQEAPKMVTEKLKEKITFATPQKEASSGGGKWVILSLVGLLLIGSALAAYYFITKNKAESDAPVAANKEVVEKEKTPTTTGTDTTKKADTSLVKTIAPKPSNDSSTFYIVIKEYQDLAMATKRLEKLVSYGNKLVLTTTDSVTYKMKMPFRLPLTDTLRIKDSLSVFFQAKARVELP
jgi:hypothetical protein